MLTGNSLFLAENATLNLTKYLETVIHDFWDGKSFFSKLGTV